MSTVLVPFSTTVNYAEVAESDSPVGEYDALTNKITTNKIYQCDWDDLWTFIRDFCGYTEIVGGNYVVHQPHQYQPVQFISNVYATKASYRPFSGPVSIPADLKVSEYNLARVTITYSGDSPIYISETITGTSEYLTLSHEKLCWLLDSTHTPLPESAAPHIIVRSFNWQIKFHNLFTFPSGLLNLVGYANAYNVYSQRLNYWFAAGTLLCGNPIIDAQTAANGALTGTATFNFTHLNNGTYAYPLGWNYFPRAEKAVGGAMWYERIAAIDAPTYGINFIPYADFRPYLP